MEETSIMLARMSITDVRSIIAQWPTRQEFAEEIGQPVDLVHKWARRNAIPAWHQNAVLKACVSRGVAVTGDDLIAMHAAQHKGAA